MKYEIVAIIKSSIRLAWHLKVRIRALVVDRKRMSCSSNGTLSLYQFSIQSASARQNSDIPSPVFCRMTQNVVWKLNFRIGNNPPCIKKFQNFCLIFFLRKITSNSRWCRFMKNREGNWDVLLAITWVKYFVCYLWSFSQVSLKQAIFFKNIVK